MAWHPTNRYPWSQPNSVSAEITPSCKPISPLIGLKVEPGGYEAISALLNNGSTDVSTKQSCKIIRPYPSYKKPRIIIRS